jgi:hypothetical protein
MTSKRPHRTYDHRLVQFVQDLADISIATRIGVPRSTAAGWIRKARPAVTSVPQLESSLPRLRLRVSKLERRVRLLTAMLRVLLAVARILEPSFSKLRVSIDNKQRFVRAIDRSRGVVGLRRVLKLVGLSPSRLHAWRTAAQECELPDHAFCPAAAPHQLTM